MADSMEDPQAPPEPQPDPPLTTLTFTDRSRYMTGLQGCPTERYLQYHSGPTGYGIVVRAQHVPLATGIRVHRMMAAVLELFRGMERPKSVPEAEEAVQEKLPQIRAALAEELDRYFRYCARKASGWVGDGMGRPVEQLGPEAVHTMMEQAALQSGLVLGWVRTRLPQLLFTFSLLAIEEEEELVVACDCGLGDGLGDFGDHGARGCTGVGLQSRPDVLLQRWLDGSVSNHDWKTAAYMDGPWSKQWQDNIQMTIGIAGAERRLGVKIDEYYVHGLEKGQRKKGWTGPNQYDGPKRQQSSFCYVEVRQSNPPLQELSFHTTGKWHEKQPTWEAPFQHGLSLAGMSAGQVVVAQLDWWTQRMRMDDLTSLYLDVGPYMHRPQLLASFLDGLKAEELQWRQRLWRLWELAEERGEPATALMQQVIPPSWNCHKFKRDCDFIPICFRWAGWEDPLGMETDAGKPRYELRAPHHTAEWEQAKQRGISLPLDEEEEEED